MSSYSLLSGGSGNDVLHVFNPFDEYYYYEDEPFGLASVEDLDDFLFIPLFNNTVEGGSGNDIIYSDALVSDSRFKGNSGDDFIVIEEGEFNTVEGGADNDFLVSLSDGGNFYGQTGDDVLIRLGGEDIEEDEFPPFADDVSPLGANNAGLNILPDFPGVPVFPSFGLLSGGSGNDVLLSFTAIGDIEGNSGNDLLIGAVGFGSLDGGSDADILLAFDGEFGLSGGGGNDIMLDIFNDTFERSGGSGNDIMLTAFGTGDASGGQGHDVILAGLGSDYYINGNSGDDVILGVALEDSTLEGSSGNDALLDAIGGNTLRGGSGEDILVAGLGNGLFETYETLFDEGSVLESVGDKAVSLFNEVINTYQPILGDFADTIDEQFVNAIDLLEVAGDNNPGDNSMIFDAEEGLGNFINDIGG
ncbi:MAG: hypothetical protein MK137_06595, partial [Rickettsiales bacterium]|nr:hypothetical protein [Rickettsiales bacterium]